MARDGAEPYRDAPPVWRAPDRALRRRNFVAVAIACVPGLVAIGAYAYIAVWARTEPRWIQFLGIGIGASWLVVPTIWSLNAFAHVRRGELAIDRSGLSLAGELVLPIDELECAEVIRRGWGGTWRVALRRRGARFPEELMADNEGEAAHIVELLGFGPEDAPLVFRTPGRLFRLGLFPAFSIFAMFGALVAILAGVAVSPRGGGGMSTLGEAVAIAVAVAEVAGFFALARRATTHVQIGRDGVALRRVGRERTIPWSEVRAVEAWSGQQTRYGRALPAGVDLVLAGERVGIYTAAENRRCGVYDRDLVAQRILELWPKPKA